MVYSSCTAIISFCKTAYGCTNTNRSSALIKRLQHQKLFVSWAARVNLYLYVLFTGQRIASWRAMTVPTTTADIFIWLRRKLNLCRCWSYRVIINRRTGRGGGLRIAPSGGGGGHIMPPIDLSSYESYRTEFQGLSRAIL